MEKYKNKKNRFTMQRILAYLMAVCICIGGIPIAYALGDEEHVKSKTLLIYNDAGTEVDLFEPSEEFNKAWSLGIENAMEQLIEEGYENLEIANEKDMMIYVSKENIENAVNYVKTSMDEIQDVDVPYMEKYDGGGGEYFLWRLCKAIKVEEDNKADDTEKVNQSTEQMQETAGNVRKESIEYFWVRTYNAVEIDLTEKETINTESNEISESIPSEVIETEAAENKTEVETERLTAVETETDERNEDESETLKRVENTEAIQSAVKEGENKSKYIKGAENVDVVVTSWVDFKREVENTPVNGNKVIGIGADFPSTKVTITFGLNGKADIRVVNLGNYVIDCSVRATSNAVSTGGGTLRIYNSSDVTFENLKFNGGMTDNIKDVAKSDVSKLFNGSLGGAWEYYSFVGIKAGTLDIIGNQTEFCNFLLYADNASPLIAVGTFDNSLDAVLNFREGKVHNIWGMDGTITLTQGKRAITNIYGGEFYNNFARDEGMFDLWDGYGGALNFYGGAIHDNYGTAYDGNLTNTVATMWTSIDGMPQNEAQGPVRFHLAGSGGENQGIKVHNNYHLRNKSNGFATAGSGQELVSNMGLIWNYNASTGAALKRNAQCAVVFDMTTEDYLQIGPTTYNKTTTGYLSPSGQIKLATDAGMTGAPYAYFSDSNPDDGVAEGMYLDYADSPNSTMFNEKYGLYEGDLPSGVESLNYNGRNINKMLYLTNRVADITYKLYKIQGNTITEMKSFNGTEYPFTKRLGLPENYGIAITAPVDLNGEYIATEYKWDDEGGTNNKLSDGSTPKKTMKSNATYTVNLYYVPIDRSKTIVYKESESENAKIYKQIFETEEAMKNAKILNNDASQNPESLTMPNFEEPAGQKFGGWSVQVNDTKAMYQPGDQLTEAEDMILYPVWIEKTYKVSYELSGAQGGIPLPFDYLKGENVTVADIVDITPPENKLFDFWESSSAVKVDGTDTTKLYPNDIFIMPAQDITLKAIWKGAKTDITFEGFEDGSDALLKVKNETGKVNSKVLPKIKINGADATLEDLEKMTYTYERYTRTGSIGNYTYGWSGKTLQEGLNDADIQKLPISITKPAADNPVITANTKKSQSGIVKLTIQYNGDENSQASCIIISPGDVDLNGSIRIADIEMQEGYIGGDPNFTLDQYVYQKMMADMNSEAITGTIRVTIQDLELLEAIIAN